MLDLGIDPKLAWALKHRDRFPVDVNRAPREMLLRVPGLGVRRRWTGCSRPRRHRTLRMRRPGPAAAAAGEAAALPGHRRPPAARRAAGPRRPAPASSRRGPASPRRPGRCSWPCYERQRRHPAPGQADFAGWRQRRARLLARGRAARAASTGASPATGPACSAARAPPAEAAPVTARVPRAFLELAEVAIRHRDPERFALLYRLLWRLARASPGCWRWRPTPTSSGCRPWPSRCGATRTRCTPSCASAACPRPTGPSATSPGSSPTTTSSKPSPASSSRRFAGTALVDPDAGGERALGRRALRMGRRGRRRGRRREDALEELWRAYYRSIFNPARLKPARCGPRCRRILAEPAGERATSRG